MKGLKDKLKELIEQLPDQPEQGFKLPHLESFPDLLYFLAQQQREYYPPGQLEKLAQEKPFEFAFLLNKLSDALEVQEAWLKDCETLLKEEGLNEFTRNLLLQQQELLAATNEKLKTIQDQFPVIREEKQKVEEAVARLGEKEPLYQELIDNKTALQERLETLNSLKEEVETGKLEELAEKVKALERELQPQIEEKDRLEMKNKELLKQQQEAQEKVQQLARQAQAMGQNEEWLEKVKAELAAHNKDIQNSLEGQAAELRIRIEFDRQTSGGIDAGAMASRLKQLEQQLNDIEREVRAHIPDSNSINQAP